MQRFARRGRALAAASPHRGRCLCRIALVDRRRGRPRRRRRQRAAQFDRLRCSNGSTPIATSPSRTACPCWCARLSAMQAFKDAETSRRLYRLHCRRARRQSGARRDTDRQDAADRAGRSLGAGARDRLFRPAELEGAARHLRRSHADAPRHDRQISRRQIADARPDRLPERRSRACSTRSRSPSSSATSPRRRWCSSRARN